MGSGVSAGPGVARGSARAEAEEVLVEVAGAGVRQVLAAAHVTEARRRVGAVHLERLRSSLPDGLPVLYVPELFTRATGRRVVSLIATALGEELDVVA